MAIVESSSNAANPPKRSFVYTPVEWEYRPVRIVERLGQQTGLTTYAFVNVTPWLPS
ncbi:MAG: hypothetical protein L0206_19950 [Actinobacteria bacterium]|nr:hypothetical protein [Actinomycetota bacterium]